MHQIMSLSLAEQSQLRQMLLEGKSYSAIHRQLGISPPYISKYKKLHNLPITPNRAGRPRLISEADRRRLVRVILSGQADTAPEAMKLLGLKVSKSAIRKVLRHAGLRGRVKVRKPLLKKRHLRDRLDFALTHRHKTPADWAKVFFSDEVKINLMGSDGRRYCWKKPNEGITRRTTSPTVKHGGGSVMIWGCMTAQGVGRMCIVEGIMDARKYTQILDQNLMPSVRDHRMQRDFLFQQDNDPKHTSAKAKEWFEHYRIEPMKWPAQSPDLNPIEHLWDHLKRQLNSYENPPSGTIELERRIKHEWNNINPEICRKLVESMPRRLKAVIKARGGSTKY